MVKQNSPLFFLKILTMRANITLRMFVPNNSFLSWISSQGFKVLPQIPKQYSNFGFQSFVEHYIHPLNICILNNFRKLQLQQIVHLLCPKLNLELITRIQGGITVICIIKKVLRQKNLLVLGRLCVFLAMKQPILTIQILFSQ